MMQRMDGLSCARRGGSTLLSDLFSFLEAKFVAVFAYAFT